MYQLVAALAAIAAAVEAREIPTPMFMSSISKTESRRVSDIKDKIKAEGKLNPQEHYYDALIDHFTNHGAGSDTYKMRYLVDHTYFDKDNGPILFYAGNEGDVWTFFDNSGFMTTTLAEKFGALVIFGEHRYFGTSMPFGDASMDKENLKYLTVESAMMDYVEFILDFKEAEGL